MTYEGKRYERVEITDTLNHCEECPFKRDDLCRNLNVGLSEGDCFPDNGKAFVWCEVKPTDQPTIACTGITLKPNEQLTVIQTDKTRKEQAERDIVSILERLDGQLEMWIAGVVVQNESLEGYKPSVTILLK